MTANHLWFLIGMFLIIVLINKPEEPDTLSQEQMTYCGMVAQFKETKGQYGWPDYRGNFRKVCK